MPICGGAGRACQYFLFRVLFLVLGIGRGMRKWRGNGGDGVKGGMAKYDRKGELRESNRNLPRLWGV